MTFTDSADINDAEGPQILSLTQRARFYKDENGRELVEISFVGQKDTVVQYVTPQHMASYKTEWDRYCDREPMQLRAGTPLRELFDERTEQKYVLHNVHNLEELAALSDSQCQGVGHGTMTDRETARQKLLHDQFEADAVRRKKIDAMPAVGLTAAPDPELGRLKDEIKEIADGNKAEINAVKEAVGEMREGMKTLQEAVLALLNRPAPAPEPKRQGWPKGKKRKPYARTPAEPPPPEEV